MLTRRTRLLTPVLIGLLAAPSLLAQRSYTFGSNGLILEDTKGKLLDRFTASHALLIGNSDYNGASEWNDLESVPDELARVEQTLKQHGFEVQKHLNLNSARLKSVFNQFIKTYGYADDDARLLFFFAGHGYSKKSRDGKLRGYILPTDAPSPEDKEFMPKALSMIQIESWARQFTAKHAIFFFDSCFSGQIFARRASSPPPPGISLQTAKPVRYFITAGSADEKVPPKSRFVPFLIDGLAGKADRSRDGYITGTELGMYLYDELTAERVQTPQHDKIADPDLDEGDFVFPLPSTPLEGVTVSPAATPPPVNAEQSDSYANAADGLTYRWAPPGTFQMGCIEREGSVCVEEEKPRHTVELSSGFWIGESEVTEGAFERFVQADPEHRAMPKWTWGDSALPIANVTWLEADAYCQWVGGRLPTEAEWEYAARGGRDGNLYSWGDEAPDESRGNFEGLDGPVGVKRYPPNDFGLYDMAGNVFEWTADWYGTGYYRVAPRTDPQGPEDGESKTRVFRGGDYSHGAYGAEVSFRGYAKPNTGSVNVGFRCVLPESR